MKADDEAAFCDFVTGRSASLLRTAFLLTGDAGEAEDAVQAMFGRVYLAWPRIRHREAVDAYCRKTLVREVASWRRRRRVTHVLTAEVPDSPGPVDVRDEPSEALRAALLALPIRQRAVVVLRYYADMSEADIATVLDISRGAVKQHTHRALAKLRTALSHPAQGGPAASGPALIEENES